MAKDLQDTEQRKQEFVSMITHDLRTPLTSMRTVLTTLAESTESRKDEDDSQRIGVLERSVDRMINLVNDLLDIDKIEAGLLVLDFTRTNFKEVLESSIESLQHLASQREIKIAHQPVDIEVDLDRKRMGQILVNLIANAIKFSPRGSTVSVDVSSDDKCLTVKVIDTGRGIPEQQLGAIFDRFKQVEQADSTRHGGSGLGLSITKALVELHHGTIGVESSPEKGSTFWFRIPIRQDAVEAERES
jgi:signal transduction histidine kinase